MSSLAQSVYRESKPGVEAHLPRAGSALENPYVFDAIAQEFQKMELEGLIKILKIHTRLDKDQPLIHQLLYKRVR